MRFVVPADVADVARLRARRLNALRLDPVVTRRRDGLLLGAHDLAAHAASDDRLADAVRLAARRGHDLALLFAADMDVPLLCRVVRQAENGIAEPVVGGAVVRIDLQLPLHIHKALIIRVRFFRIRADFAAVFRPAEGRREVDVAHVADRGENVAPGRAAFQRDDRRIRVAVRQIRAAELPFIRRAAIRIRAGLDQPELQARIFCLERVGVIRRDRLERIEHDLRRLLARERVPGAVIVGQSARQVVVRRKQTVVVVVPPDGHDRLAQKARAGDRIACTITGRPRCFKARRVIKRLQHAVRLGSGQLLLPVRVAAVHESGAHHKLHCLRICRVHGERGLLSCGQHRRAAGRTAGRAAAVILAARLLRADDLIAKPGRVLRLRRAMRPVVIRVDLELPASVQQHVIIRVDTLDIRRKVPAVHRIAEERRDVGVADVAHRRHDVAPRRAAAHGHNGRIGKAVGQLHALALPLVDRAVLFVLAGLHELQPADLAGGEAAVMCLDGFDVIRWDRLHGVEDDLRRLLARERLVAAVILRKPLGQVVIDREDRVVAVVPRDRHERLAHEAVAGHGIALRIARLPACHKARRVIERLQNAVRLFGCDELFPVRVRRVHDAQRADKLHRFLIKRVGFDLRRAAAGGCLAAAGVTAAARRAAAAARIQADDAVAVAPGKLLKAGELMLHAVVRVNFQRPAAAQKLTVIRVLPVCILRKCLAVLRRAEERRAVIVADVADRRQNIAPARPAAHHLDRRIRVALRKIRAIALPFIRRTALFVLAGLDQLKSADRAAAEGAVICLDRVRVIGRDRLERVEHQLRRLLARDRVRDPEAVLHAALEMVIAAPNFIVVVIPADAPQQSAAQRVAGDSPGVVKAREYRVVEYRVEFVERRVRFRAGQRLLPVGIFLIHQPQRADELHRLRVVRRHRLPDLDGQPRRCRAVIKDERQRIHAIVQRMQPHLGKRDDQLAIDLVQRIVRAVERFAIHQNGLQRAHRLVCRDLCCAAAGPLRVPRRGRIALPRHNVIVLCVEALGIPGKPVGIVNFQRRVGFAKRLPLAVLPVVAQLIRVPGLGPAVAAVPS